MIKLKNLLKEAELDKSADTIKSKISGDYTAFVKYFQNVGRDPKILAFLNYGTNKDKFSYQQTNLLVSQLIPTQNEIDVDKSLSYPLSHDKMAHSYLYDDVITIKAPLLIFDNKYIIDGHHRWSQVFAVNTKAKMSCYNLINDNIKNPIDVLKSAQLSILALTGKIPIAHVKGHNLLNIDFKNLALSIQKYLDADVVKVFNQFFIENKIPAPTKRSGIPINIEVAKALTSSNIPKDVIFDTLEKIYLYIWKNVSIMKQNGIMKGAQSREVMPQTDTGTETVTVAKKMSSNNPPNVSGAGIESK